MLDDGPYKIRGEGGAPCVNLILRYVSEIATRGLEPHQVTLFPPVCIRMDCLVKNCWRDPRSWRNELPGAAWFHASVSAWARCCAIDGS